jgi:putative endopeptidase
VNLVVNQFDEFYEAFDIAEGDKMWRAPAARIRIF